KAAELARYLEGENEKRQKIERQIFAQVRERVGTDEDAPALVLADPEWHPGIIGIVASRLADLYARPALLIALRPDRSHGTAVGQGSGRSIPGFPLHEALHACDDLLLSHGGHAAAAGFKIRPDAIDSFRDRLHAFVQQHFPAGLPSPELTIDAEVPL